MLFAVWDAAEPRWWFWLCAPPADTPQAAPPVYPEPEDLPAAIAGCLATGMREAETLEAGRAQELRLLHHLRLPHARRKAWH